MIENKMLAKMLGACRPSFFSRREGVGARRSGGDGRRAVEGTGTMSVSGCCSTVLRPSENKMLASGPLGQVPCREERRAGHVRGGACAGGARVNGEVQTRVKHRGGGADSRAAPWSTVEAVQTRVTHRGGGADSRGWRGESWTYKHWDPGGFVREDFTGTTPWALVSAPQDSRVDGPWCRDAGKCGDVAALEDSLC